MVSWYPWITSFAIFLQGSLADGALNFSRALSERDLKRYLLRDYDRTTRPAEMTDLYIDFSLSRIVYLDGRTQMLTFVYWMKRVWNDTRLMWNPADFHSVEEIYMNRKYLWIPDVSLFEDVLEEFASETSFPIRVNSDGEIEDVQRKFGRVFCPIDAYNFPFDLQICQLRFESCSYDDDELIIHNMTAFSNLSFMVDTFEWKVLEIPIRRINGNSSLFERGSIVAYFIVLQRQSLFYLFHLTLPCVLLTMITVSGFLLPPISGEKVGLGVTTMLSLVVFLHLVSESIPPQSSVIPLIGIYFGGTVILLAISTASTVVVLNIHHRGELLQRMPKKMRKFVFGTFAWALGMDHVARNIAWEVRLRKKCFVEAARHGESSPQIVSEERAQHGQTCVNSPVSGCNLKDLEMLTILRRILSKLSSFQRTYFEHERLVKIDAEWRLFATLLDRLLFYLFLFFSVILFTVFIWNINKSTSYKITHHH